LNGAILSSERGVGAHTKHLSENNLRAALDCSECHTLPNSFLDPNHIDKTPGAKLVFGNFTKTSTNVPGGFNYKPDLGSLDPNPSFDVAAGTCANTYCHGYFKNGNTDNIVAFTAQSQGSACGSCHGDPTTGNPLPKTPTQGGVHPPNQNCASVYCHGDVVSIDSTSAQIYTIIDKNKHINGKLNFAGNEYTY
jgi:predicted CxxxxCH...CXXCH cytochrome family protein